jgi:hypothetical protein
VHIYDDNARLPGRSLDEHLRRGQVEKVGVVVVGRERQERDPDPIGLDQRYLTRQAGLRQTRRVDRLNGLGLTGSAEVERVVIGVVEDGEAGPLEVTRVTRRIPERETCLGGAFLDTALAGRRRRERAFQIAEDNRPRRNMPPGQRGDPACSRASCRRPR